MTKKYNIVDNLRSMVEPTLHPLEEPVIQDLLNAIIVHLLKTHGDDILSPDLTKDTHTAAEREKVFGVLRSIKDGVHPNCYPDVIATYSCTIEDNGLKKCSLGVYFYDMVLEGAATMGMVVQKVDRPSLWEKAQGYSDIPLMVDTYINDKLIIKSSTTELLN